MAKYEIMLLVDPKEEGKQALELANSIFPNFNGKKLENSELAYEINHSKTGRYIVSEVEASSEQVSEFRRKANILKSLWRYIVINLDKEVGRDKAAEAMERHAKKVAERAAERAAIREARTREYKARENRDREYKPRENKINKPKEGN